MSVIITEVTREELRELIEESIRKALREMLEDPDYGLEMRDELVERILTEASLPEEELRPASEVAARLGIAW